MEPKKKHGGRQRQLPWLFIWEIYTSLGMKLDWKTILDWRKDASFRQLINLGPLWD